MPRGVMGTVSIVWLSRRRASARSARGDAAPIEEPGALEASQQVFWRQKGGEPYQSRIVTSPESRRLAASVIAMPIRKPRKWKA